MSIEELKIICNEKKIKYTADVGLRKLLYIEIPKKRKFNTLRINDEAAEKILELAPNFYKYKFVEGYEAIWSSEEGVLECEIDLANGGFSLLRLLNPSSDKDENKSISIPPYKEGVKIEISTASNMFALFTILRDQSRFVRPLRLLERIREGCVTIKISGIEIAHHEQILTIIRNICSSICFQIECKTELPIMLVFEKKLRTERKKSRNLENFELSSIKYTYDHEALSLYWYAQSAFGMPLLKYLALYQVVEFYYPIYSELDAQKKIKNILKDPNFSAQNDKEIAKVLNVVKFNTSSGVFGNELSQLKATVKECLIMTQLREWLIELQERKDYFLSPEAKKLSKFVINSEVEDEALLDQVVQRFYNIRCRIVHTKGAENDLDVLHPQSKELVKIDYDIELAKFIAQRVLISSSKPLK